MRGQIGVPRTLSAVERADLITYSPWIAVVFIMNMMMGSGPLALPYGFAQTGVVLAGVFLALITVIAYATVTFLVESLVIANVLLKFRGDIGAPPIFEPAQVNGRTVFRAIVPHKAFKITKRLEIGQLAEVYFGKWGVRITYGCLLVYTVGVLAVYAVAVPEALQTMFAKTVFGISTYYAILICFAVVALPFCFGNFQNTRVLQVVVIALRFLCVACMIYATITIISDGNGVPSKTVFSHSVEPSGIPWMIGNSVFTFMIHHSVPGIAAPVSPQSGIKKALFVAFGGALIAYIVLCGTAVFAFTKVDGIYNLNFTKFRYRIVAVFLQVYPALVVALFPLICITLRNNIMNAFALCGTQSDYAGLGGARPAFGRRLSRASAGESQRLITPGLTAPGSPAGSVNAPAGSAKPPLSFKKQALYTFIAAIPPLIIAACTDHIQLVLTVTGALPGIGLMLLIPCLMVHQARKALARRVARATSGGASPSPGFGELPEVEVENPQQSPFKSALWLYAIFIIGVASCVFDTYSLINSWVK